MWGGYMEQVTEAGQTIVLFRICLKEIAFNMFHFFWNNASNNALKNLKKMNNRCNAPFINKASQNVAHCLFFNSLMTSHPANLHMEYKT